MKQKYKDTGVFNNEVKMREIRGELESCLKQLELFQKNFNNEAQKHPDRRLYCYNRKGKPSFSVATSVGGFHSPKRKSINNDKGMMLELLAEKTASLAADHVARNISCIKTAIAGFEEFDMETLIEELPAAYRSLPEEIFHDFKAGRVPGKATGGSWARSETGIIVPDRLKKAAAEGSLTALQKQEIREIQKAWAALPYNLNTKNQALKRKITSRGLPVRSKSEVSIAEMLYHYDIPFRYDEVINVGKRMISPDFTFFSILSGEICWEHAGLTNKQSYIDHHRYKRGLYESIGMVPWKNYIETYDEDDGSIDMRIVEAEIKNKLLKWLFLE